MFFILREKEHKQRGGSEGKGEADSLLSRDPPPSPKAGLDPRTLGS